MVSRALFFSASLFRFFRFLLRHYNFEIVLPYPLRYNKELSVDNP